LLVTSLAAGVVTVLLPLLPTRSWFGFGVPSIGIVVVVAAIVVAYVAATEAAKRFVRVERCIEGEQSVGRGPQ
jgi:predicted cation transporter